MRVLFLTHRVPFPPNSGDRLRAFHMARVLAEHVHLELVSLAHDAHELLNAEALRSVLRLNVTALRTAPLRNYAHGGLALLGTRPLTHCLLDAPRMTDTLIDTVRRSRPDVVLAYCSGMARFALQHPLRELPLVVDFVDVDSRKWAALAEATAPPRRWIYAREARYLGAFEALAARRAVASIVVNQRERESLRALAPNAAIEVIGNGVDVGHLRPPKMPSSDARVVFCGVMSYPPNVDGAAWLATEVWPLVRARHPGASLLIVGANPTDAVRKLASPTMAIEVTGSVPDVRPYLWDAAVGVAPLRTARGVQNKVLEALAAGLPVVVTPQVSEGLPRDAHPGCRVASDGPRFAEEILSLLALAPPERRAVAARASLDSLGWAAQLRPLLGILEQASTIRRPAIA